MCLNLKDGMCKQNGQPCPYVNHDYQEPEYCKNYRDATQQNWLEMQGREYSIEASEIDHTGVANCPGCSRLLLGPDGWTIQRIPHKSNGDLTHWTAVCSCGARLTIFND